MAAADIQIATSQMARSITSLVKALQDCTADAENLIKTCNKAAGLLTINGEATGKRKREKKVKDPNQPKRPASSYLIFQNEKRKELRDKFPELTHMQLTNMISEQWAKMTDADKKPFSDKHAAADVQYKANLKVYNDAKSEATVEAESPPPVPVAAKPAKKVAAPRKVAEKPKPTTKKSAPIVTEFSEEEDEEDESESESEEDSLPSAKAAPAATSDSEVSDSDSDSEEPPPPPKKQKKQAPKSVAKDKKKKT